MYKGKKPIDSLVIFVLKTEKIGFYDTLFPHCMFYTTYLIITKFALIISGSD